MWSLLEHASSSEHEEMEAFCSFPLNLDRLMTTSINRLWRKRYYHDSDVKKKAVKLPPVNAYSGQNQLSCKKFNYPETAMLGRPWVGFSVNSQIWVPSQQLISTTSLTGEPLLRFQVTVGPVNSDCNHVKRLMQKLQSRNYTIINPQNWAK